MHFEFTNSVKKLSHSNISKKNYKLGVFDPPFPQTLIKFKKVNSMTRSSDSASNAVYRIKIETVVLEIDGGQNLPLPAP